ncbi:hypothetical protein [Aquimarina sp. MMG016]|uniref:hypothetical protein n=1 Tax=Aquimarina sp. MMG016 TaxID=2822690 RepID=UPI001B3A20E6|nr:hypothetical protein [Aquimarina sp. MMG016]MBQ4822075.1 hypothetical protein [Aquimarina sp. MMG016]
MKALYKNPIALILIAVTVGAFIFLKDQLPALDLSQLTPTNIIAVLGYITVVMLIVEQFIEIFVNDPDEKNKMQRKQRIADICKEVENETLEQATKDKLLSEKIELEGQNITRGLKRKQRILIINFGIGLLLAFSGFRILSGFLFETSLNSGASETQLTLVQSIDIILTAGIIAGGSDRVHRLIKRIKANFEEDE